MHGILVFDATTDYWSCRVNYRQNACTNMRMKYWIWLRFAIFICNFSKISYRVRLRLNGRPSLRSLLSKCLRVSRPIAVVQSIRKRERSNFRAFSSSHVAISRAMSRSGLSCRQTRDIPDSPNGCTIVDRALYRHLWLGSIHLVVLWAFVEHHALCKADTTAMHQRSKIVRSTEWSAQILFPAPWWWLFFVLKRMQIIEFSKQIFFHL